MIGRRADSTSALSPFASIALEGVFVELGGNAVLHGIDLSIARGERVALLGASGAGKSTCLRLMNGLVRATRGKVVVDGKGIESHDLVQLRRRIGWAIQEVGLLPHLDVAGNVAVVPRLLGWERARIDARVDEVLALVGLAASFRGRRPRELSGGERQRVGVARAIAASPELVLLDEPFGALDPLLRAELQREIGALLRGLSATVVLVTHDVQEALAMADRVVLLEKGRVIADGPARRFLQSAPAYAAIARETIARLTEALS
ncbi:MAG: ATP-binding cassette domain-containing protein [Polyangiales bacterium]